MNFFGFFVRPVIMPKSEFSLPTNWLTGSKTYISILVLAGKHGMISPLA